MYSLFGSIFFPLSLPLPPPSSHLSTTPLIEIFISPQPSSGFRIQDAHISQRKT